MCFYSLALKIGHIFLTSRSYFDSEHISVCWLLDPLVLDHLVLDSNEDLLHSISVVPVLEHEKLRGLDLTICLIHKWEVDFRLELYRHRLGWIIITALNFHHVNTVVEVSVWWANDGAVPLGETFVITLAETV